MRIKPSLIIQRLKLNGGKVRLTARELCISPATVINWRRRAHGGYSDLRYLGAGVTRHSTKPKTNRITSLAPIEQNKIIELRKLRGYGAIKLAKIVGTNKHHRTVHRFIKTKGLTAPNKNYRRPRYQETTHMYLKNANKPGKLQMDIKYVTPELSGLAHTTYLYAVIDIYSRYKVGIILPSLDQALAIEALSVLLPTLPFKPDFIQTDNGLEFQARFKDYITNQLGLKHHHIHKSSPNENAVIERSFRTDEEEFFWRIDGIPEDLFVLNKLYQEYLNDYNTFRPHLGIDLQTPQERINSFVD